MCVIISLVKHVIFDILAAENLGLATSPPYLALSSSSNPNYANGVNFASGGAGVSNATNKVRQSLPFAFERKDVQYI